ncbi:MAG: GatB/YqeY domain-containing protein [Verrucomicrobiota bacterium]|nr:GatB/YqeY domain-containing protein [Verrucomicrobiota bacterium]
MSLSETITNDLKDAMRAKDSLRLAVLRSLKTAITNTTIEKCGAEGELDTGAEIGVVRTAIKQRQDSIEKFQEAGRNDLAENEKKEATILEEYLPTALSEDEINKLIEEAINEAGATSRKEMGQVMKILQQKTEGRVDNKTLSSGVMQRLS